jgi:hypothetical protein
VDVRRTEIRVVHGADADESDGGTGLRVVAPNRDPASWAACDLLPLAACGGCHNDFGLASGVHDAIGFIESVERMRGPGLALAPTAMAGMNNQRRSDQTISDLPAGASALRPAKWGPSGHFAAGNAEPPMSALGQKQTLHRLLDDFVGAQQEVATDVQIKRLGGFEVDHQLEFRGLLNRKIAGFRALENLVHVLGNTLLAG